MAQTRVPVIRFWSGDQVQRPVTYPVTICTNIDAVFMLP